MREINPLEASLVCGGASNPFQTYPMCPAPSPFAGMPLKVLPGTLYTRGANPFAPGNGGTIPYVRYVRM